MLINIRYSNIMDGIGKREAFHFFFRCSFSMCGTTLTLFQGCGLYPRSMQLLSNVVYTGGSFRQHRHNIKGLMLSGPTAFEVSGVSIKVLICDSLIKNREER